MYTPGVPFPDIPRFPGERKLEGVPHSRGESVFAEPGIIDSLAITDETLGLNSSQRKPIVDKYIGEIITKPEAQKNILRGLDSLGTPGAFLINEGNGNTSPDIDRSGNARFLHTVLSEKLGQQAEHQQPKSVEVSFVEDSSASFNGQWSMNLLDGQVESVARRNKLLKDPVLRSEVGRLVAINDPNSLAVIETGVMLFRRFNTPNATPEESALLFADLAYAIDHRKQEVTSRRATTAVSNLIIGAAGSALVASLPLNQETSDLLKRFCRIGPENPKLGGFMHTKWLMIEQQFNHRRSISEFASKFTKANRLIEPLLNTAGVDLGEMATEAMEQLYALRRYGIKPAYFRDGIFHDMTDSWVVRDPNDDLEELKPEWQNMSSYVSHGIAEFSLAQGEQIEDIRGKIEMIKLEGAETRSGALYRQLPYHVFFDLGMMRDGELNLSMSRGVIPVRREFQQQGAENVYELLRLAQIMRLTDLVVPATLIKEMPRVKENPGRIGRLLNIHRFVGIDKLVVPRLRLIVEHPELVRETLEREIAEGEEQTRRLLRRHEIEGHRRDLPKGYKASPEARLRAAKLGIILGENETWVKKHSRGDERIGIVKSHQAVTRKT